jgi:FkbM family methyltransferase
LSRGGDLGYLCQVSISTFVARSLKEPSYAWRRFVWGVHQRIPERAITMPTRHGRLSFSSRDHVIGRLLCLNGEYGMEAIERAAEILGREPRRGPVLLDVGANIGTACLAPPLRALYPRAVAIEPEPGNFRLLAANIRQNGVDVQAVQCAVGERDGTANMRLSRDNYGDHRVEEGSGTIRVRRIDEILESLKLDPSEVGLVWMDIQGYEFKALRGAERLLESGPPLVTEFWPHGLRAAGSDPEELLSLLRRHYGQFRILNVHANAREVSSWTSTSELTLSQLMPAGASTDIRSECDLMLRR